MTVDLLRLAAGLVVGLVGSALSTFAVCVAGQALLEWLQDRRFSFAIWMAAAMFGLFPAFALGLCASVFLGFATAGLLSQGT